MPLGCRTYGGHGSEEETLRQIEHAIENFESDLLTARADLRAFGGRASGASRLEPIVQGFERTIQEHEAMLESHRSRLEEAVGERGSYRYVSRTLRAILSEQEALRLRYRYWMRAAESRGAAVASAAGGSGMVGADTSLAAADTASASAAGDAPVEWGRPRRGGARYHVAPPFYERLRNASLQRETEATAREVTGERTPPPDTLDAR